MILRKDIRLSAKERCFVAHINVKSLPHIAEIMLRLHQWRLVGTRK